MNIIFSLDTEDYITPEADEALKFWVDLFNSRKVKGCFNIVGEKARVLRKRGRKDIITRLKRHEINYHSNYHSLHPTLAEYVEERNWHQGVNEVIKREIHGINDVKEIFGRYPAAYMQPGDSWAPQVIHAMKLMNIPVMNWTFFAPFQRLPFWYCNSFNGLIWHFAFDRYWETVNRLERMKCDFLDIQGKCKRLGQDFVVLGTHPCKLITSRFWDDVNFRGRNKPLGERKPAPLRSDKVLRDLKNDFSKFVDFLVSSGDVQVITYQQLFNMYAKDDGNWLRSSILLPLAERIKRNFSWVALDGMVLSPAQVFALFARGLAFSNRGAFPEYIPLRNPIGPVSEFTQTAPAAKVEVGELVKSCKQVDLRVDQNREIPRKITLAGITIGPYNFLKLMADAILALHSDRSTDFIVKRDEAEQLPEITKERAFKNIKFKNKWVFPEDFAGESIIKHARLQSWTFKPAVRKTS